MKENPTQLSEYSNFFNSLSPRVRDYYTIADTLQFGKPTLQETKDLKQRQLSAFSGMDKAETWELVQFGIFRNNYRSIKRKDISKRT